MKCEYAHYKNTYHANRYDWDHETNSKPCSNVICIEDISWDQVVKKANGGEKSLYKKSVSKLTKLLK